MKKIATLGCLASLVVAGGVASAQACDDDGEYRATKRYSYSYAPAYTTRTYAYTPRAYGYAPAYYDDDDDFAYGYGPSVGVGIYGDFDRRGGRRFRYRDGDRADRGERSRAVMTGASGREIRRGGDGGAVGGGGTGGPGARSPGGGTGGAGPGGR